MKYLFSKLSFGFFINICLFLCLNCSGPEKVKAELDEVGVAANECLAHMRFMSTALSKKSQIDILASTQEMQNKIYRLESLVKNCDSLDPEDRQGYLEDIQTNRSACLALGQKYAADEKEKKETLAQLLKKPQALQEKVRREEEEELQRKLVKKLASSITSGFKELFTRNVLVVSGTGMRWERRNPLDQIFQQTLDSNFAVVAASARQQTSQLFKDDQANK